MGTAGIIFAAFVVRYFLHPYLEPYVPFHFFILGCLLVQYLYGYKFAIISVLISAALGEYYFVQPYNSFDVLSFSDLIITINFSLVAFAAIAFMEPLQRSLFSRDLLLKVLDSRHKISLYRENDRIFYSQKSNEAWSILQALLDDFDQILIIKLGESEFKVEPLFLKLTQNSELLESPENWQSAIYSEDRLQLEQAWSKPTAPFKTPQGFDLRLLHANGQVISHRVWVDHFSFMGKNLSILKLEY